MSPGFGPGDRESNAYIAPPGLLEWQAPTQWLTPLAKRCRRSAAIHKITQATSP